MAVFFSFRKYESLANRRSFSLRDFRYAADASLPRNDIYTVYAARFRQKHTAYYTIPLYVAHLHDIITEKYSLGDAIMEDFRCGKCRKRQLPADGAVFFTCRICGRINILPDSAEEMSAKYTLVDAFKKTASAKAAQKAIRASAAGYTEQFDAFCKELALLHSLGYLPEQEFIQITDKAKKRAWIMEFLKRNRNLFSYNDIQKAAEADGISLEIYEYPLLNELVHEGFLEEHRNGYCLPGAIEAHWLAQALPCRERPIDRNSLEILKAMPFAHRSMSAEFRKNMTPERITAPGQFLYFGHYGSQPILWRTLEVDEERMLLISEFCLDNVPFDSDRKNVTWQISEIRHRLNSSFLTEAFTPAERIAILPTEIMTPRIALDDGDCPEDTPIAAERTLDSVWLLSVQEAEHYFPDCNDRCPDLTAHVIAKNADRYYNSNAHNFFAAGNGRYPKSNWWLRSVNTQADCAARVSGQGKRGSRKTGKIEFPKLMVEWDDDQYLSPSGGLRPVLWLNRSAKNCCLPEAESLFQPRVLSEISDAGQRLYFGTYSGSPIIWRVLEQKDGTALLISENGLQIMNYHKSRNGWTVDYAPWEKSDLRAWLNGEFLRSAFTEQEQELLCRTTLATPDNSRWTQGKEWLEKVEGGSPTEDLVWIPGIQEVECLFSSPEDRTAGITSADQYHYASCWEADWKCFWWLRDPGKYDASASCVMPNGEISYLDADFQAMVRPMIRIRLPEYQK